MLLGSGPRIAPQLTWSHDAAMVATACPAVDVVPLVRAAPRLTVCTLRKHPRHTIGQHRAEPRADIVGVARNSKRRLACASHKPSGSEANRRDNERADGWTWYGLMVGHRKVLNIEPAQVRGIVINTASIQALIHTQEAHHVRNDSDEHHHRGHEKPRFARSADVVCSCCLTWRAEPRREHRTGADGSSALFDGHLNAQCATSAKLLSSERPLGLHFRHECKFTIPRLGRHLPTARRWEVKSDYLKACWIAAGNIGFQGCGLAIDPMSRDNQLFSLRPHPVRLLAVHDSAARIERASGRPPICRDSHPNCAIRIDVPILGWTTRICVRIRWGGIPSDLRNRTRSARCLGPRGYLEPRYDCI